ncbi:MAG: hypothetical protein AAF823_07320 [Planctomycetota bacterium]
MAEEHADRNPWQGYFDWQVTTLMLARDLHEPIRPGDETAAESRRSEMEQYVATLTRTVVPEELWNGGAAWPPEVMRAITQATIGHAQDIVDRGFEVAATALTAPG